jgi:Rieske 2Fe-2S family protein
MTTSLPTSRPTSQPRSLPSSLRPTLPGADYVDEGVFAQEQQLIFEQMWFCAVRASDLDRPGIVRTVQIGRESVLLTRAGDGEIRAFFNICSHRGALLYTEPVTEVGRNLRCPYHAWTFALDGTLVAAPNLASMTDIDRRQFGLTSVHTRQWLGYVWVCLAQEPPSFDEDVLGAVITRLGDTESIDHYDLANLAVGARITYDVRANWKLIVENFMECYHCPTIHPELVHVLPEFSQGMAAQSYVGHGAAFGERIEGFTVDGSPGQDRIPTLTEAQDRRYFAVTIRPNLFINLVPDHGILMRMFPLAVDRTIVECDWLFLPHVVADGRDLTASVELFDRVNRQDFEVCEQVQPGMSSRAYARGGVLVPSEHHLGDFHDWVRAKLATRTL